MSLDKEIALKVKEMKSKLKSITEKAFEETKIELESKEAIVLEQNNNNPF